MDGVLKTTTQGVGLATIDRSCQEHASFHYQDPMEVSEPFGGHGVPLQDTRE